MALEVGDIIQDKYRIVRRIGQGGMGAVYEGEHTLIKRRVAIKVLHPETARDAEIVLRFEQEAQAAGRIGNDHILEILDFGSLSDGSRFMVMEFLDGEPLTERLSVRTLRPEECATLFIQLLIGLEAAHAAHVVHRDLKPDNVFIVKEKAGRRDFIKIIDFGISKFRATDSDGGSGMTTRTGVFMGTPYYSAPEQVQGTARDDPRSDIYACGVMLFQCLSGTVPFEAENINQLMFKIALGEPRSLTDLCPELDDEFRTIVETAMAREAHQRFQNARAMREALELWLSESGRLTPELRASLPASLAHSGEVQLQNSFALTPGGLDTRSRETLKSDNELEQVMTPPQLDPNTDANWAQSGDASPKAGGSKRGAFLGVALAGVLLAAGAGAFVAFGDPPKEEPSSTSPVVAPAATSLQVEAPPADPTLEPNVSPASTDESAEAPAATEPTPEPTSEPTAKPPNRRTPEDSRPGPAPSPQPPAPATPAPPPPAPAPKPSPPIRKPANPTAPGQPPDFGY